MQEILKKLRKDALYLSYCCQDGNLQSVFSCIDILWTLYDKVMNWNLAIAVDNSRDFFVISKGQATLALYPILIQKGMFSMEDVSAEIGSFHSRYCIQTDLTKFSGGVENSAGSLGHGLPFAVGIAMANQIRHLNNRTFVLCGDGELMEGTMWESIMVAGEKQLKNLCIIIDDNDSAKEMVHLDNLREKFNSFHIATAEIDGHDTDAIQKVLQADSGSMPLAVIAHTKRGYGSKTMMNEDIWFHKAPNREELILLCQEVDEF